MNKKEWYELVLNAIEVKFDRGSSNQWKNRDFEDLSTKILDSTKVLISISTLKRIYGQIKTNEEYFPFPATLDALVKYSEITIKEPRTATQAIPPIHKTVEKEISNDITIEETYTNKQTNNKTSVKSIIYIFVVLIFISFTYFWINKKSESNPKVDFTIKKIDGIKSCATVLFNIDISEIKDSVFFVDGLHKELYLTPQTNFFSVFLNKPGKHRCFLKTKKVAISDTLPVIVFTNGWESYLNYFFDNSGNKFVFFKPEQQIDNGNFHITEQVLKNNNVDLNRQFAFNFDNYKKTNVDGDNFVLETEFTVNDFWNNRKCRTFNIRIDAENSSISFGLANIGCSKYTLAEVSELQFNESKQDLTNLSIDFNGSKKVYLENRNKNLDLKIDGISIFKQKYNKQLGKIVGISINMNGDGLIKSLDLKAIKNDSIVFHF